MAEVRFIIYAMKNIAVFVHSFSVEYSDLVINGIHKFFENCKDVRVYFAQTSHPHYHGGVYDYMHWASFEYFKSKSIDEVIVVSNSYSVYMAEEKIREVMVRAMEERAEGADVSVSIMKKNKKFQKEQLMSEGYETIEEIFEERG